jgi:uncharacterized membrane protein
VYEASALLGIIALEVNTAMELGFILAMKRFLFSVKSFESILSYFIQLLLPQDYKKNVVF